MAVALEEAARERRWCGLINGFRHYYIFEILHAEQQLEEVPGSARARARSGGPTEKTSS